MELITSKNYLVGLDKKIIKLDRICDYYILKRKKTIAGKQYLDLKLIIRIGVISGKLLPNELEIFEVEEYKKESNEIEVRCYYDFPVESKKEISEVLCHLKEVAKLIRDEQKKMIY